MRSEIPATSGWLWVRCCAWGQTDFPVVRRLVFLARVETGVTGAVCGLCVLPEGCVVPGSVIRLREVNRPRKDWGLTWAFERQRLNPLSPPQCFGPSPACLLATSPWSSVLCASPPLIRVPSWT